MRAQVTRRRAALLAGLVLMVAASAAALVLTPRTDTYDVLGVPASSDADAVQGARIFADVCARCHGEDGRGRPPTIPPLLGSDVVAGASPAMLLRRIVAAVPGGAMPAYGTRLGNAEIVAVLNHVRAAWGGRAPRVELDGAAPPPEIEALNQRFVRALKANDVTALAACYGRGARLVRGTDLDVEGRDVIHAAWSGYLRSLDQAGARVSRVSLPDARYGPDVDGVVVAAGRIYFETRGGTGPGAASQGRFLRTYEVEDGRWVITFDFAETAPPGLGTPPGNG